MNLIEQTPGLIILNIILYGVIVAILYAPFRRNHISRYAKSISLLLILMFCTFAFWGADWFGYLYYFDVIKSGTELSTVEPIYSWIISVLSPNYIVFRLIVWGAALILLYKTIKNLELDIPYTLFFFGSIYLIWFSYARASLSMAMMFYGLSLLHRSYKNTLFTKIIACALIILSFYFHKSSIFGIIVIILAELMVLFKLNKKWMIVLLLILFPLIAHFLSLFLNIYLSSSMLDEETTLSNYMSAGVKYLMDDNNTIGIGVMIHRFFERFPYYMLAFLSCRLIFYRRPIKKNVLPFVWCLILLILAASLFAFSSNLNTSVLYGRFIRYAQIPSCLVLTYMYSNRIYPKAIRFTYRIAVLGVVYILLYVLYNCIQAMAL